MQLKLEAQQKHYTKLLSNYLSADAILNTCVAEKLHKIA